MQISDLLMIDSEIIQKQKALADKVLDRLEIIDPSCIVAGGAPRDWVMGKPATDIDVFMTVREDSSICNLAKQISKALSIDVTEVAYNKLMQEIRDNSINRSKPNKTLQLYRTNPNIICVFDLVIECETFQIICLKSSTYSLIESFPFGICKVWYKKSAINTTPAFDLALILKVLVLSGNAYGSSDFYVKKMREKFKASDGWMFFASVEDFNRYYL